MMAEHYCNAGLASQALGQLPQAMDYYESGRQAYAWAANLAGQAWVHSLFAEALLAQRQQPRAARHFEQALALLRRQAHIQPDRAAQEWAGTLTLYAPDLLAANPARLRELAEEGLNILREQLAAHPTDRDLLASATKLTVLEAKTSADGSEAVVSRGEELLKRFRTAAGPDFWTALGYYPAAADLAALRAGQAHATSQMAAYSHYRSAALAYRDSVAEPRARARTTLGLAQQLMQWHDYTVAVRELRLLLPVYQAAANRPELQTVYALLTRAYAGTGRLDSAFVAQSRAMALDDSLRNQAQQATLAEAETRYHTRLQEARISQLTEDEAQASQQNRLARLSVGLLLLLGGAVFALRTARRLNRRLDAQRRQIEEQAESLTEVNQTKRLWTVSP